MRFLPLLCLTLTLQAQEIHLQVLSTTDIHGAILPKNPFTLKPDNQGWLRLASLIKEKKALNPSTVLVDSGNTLSGDPVNYVRNTLKPELPEPSIAIMNSLGYNAMAVGNRDFDYGFKVLRGIEDQARFPLLSANTVYTETQKPAFTPYVIVQVNGIRVAILGLTAASVRVADPRYLDGITFLDPVETAQTYVPKLHSLEKADVVIVAIHGGLGTEGKDGPSTMSARPVKTLAEKVSGIDLILAGDTHEALATRISGVPVLQAQAYGHALGIADMEMRQVKHGWSGSSWTLQGCKVYLEEVKETTPEDPEVLKQTAPLIQATDAYLNTFVTRLADDFNSSWVCMEDTPLMEFYHIVMQKAVGAQLAAASCPNSHLFIPRGVTSVRQFFGLMPYEDKVARIALTGTQLKAYLEHAARLFNHSFESQLFNTNISIRDFDTISGVHYTLDLSKPVGYRVTRLEYQGKPVANDQIFTMAITAYRLEGGGGYMDAIGFKGKAEVFSNTSLRNLLLEYALAHPNLSTPPNNHWRTVPFMDRERVLAQQP